MSDASNAPADVGLIGLGTMGQNLALNIADHGYRIAVYNRTTAVTDEFLAANPNPPGGLIGRHTIPEFLRSLKRPRIVIVLVAAGLAVEAVIKQLVTDGIEPNDLVVDAGNSLWTDTIRREKEYAGKLIFFGSGVSGGAEGARFGPSLMPGGDQAAWKRLRPIWEAIAAKVDLVSGKPIEGAAPGRPVKGGEPCTAYLGPDGAGHYVKMIHNGIEYADMQLIAEAYHLMREALGLTPPEMAAIFARWNETELDSYLIEITADILRQRDPANPEQYFVDAVLDAAGQKGTGKWTSVNALDMGVPASTIAIAVFERMLAAAHAQRQAASQVLRGPTHAGRSKVATASGADQSGLIESIRQALYCSKICAYAQGFQLMRGAQSEYRWTLDFGTIAAIWRGGCIIRARFLQKITEAFRREPALVNLMLDPHFAAALERGQEAWRRVVCLGASLGVPCPAFASALTYYDGYRSPRLPANLIQAQRDYFGAHTYERVDRPRGEFFHVDWMNPKRPEMRA